MDSAHVTNSPGNPAEDGYTTMTMKKCGDVKAVTFSENNKIRKNFRTPMYRVWNSSSHPIVSKQIKTIAFFVSSFYPQVSVRDVENSWCHFSFS